MPPIQNGFLKYGCVIKNMVINKLFLSMPCSCLIPMPDFPTNCEWGPILWRILHGLAEHYGKLMYPLFLKEEENAWPKFIEQTQYILPCKECREHYKDYYLKNKPFILKNLSSEQKGVWIKNYFFNLHNEVNIRNDKPLFEYSNLHNTYKNINYTFEIKHFEKLLKVVFQYNEVSLVSWLNWIKTFRTIANIYGLT